MKAIILLSISVVSNIAFAGTNFIQSTPAVTEPSCTASLTPLESGGVGSTLSVPMKKEEKGYFAEIRGIQFLVSNFGNHKFLAGIGADSDHPSATATFNDGIGQLGFRTGWSKDSDRPFGFSFNADIICR